MREWKGKRVTVMGLGAFSGGVTVTRFLTRAGAKVTVTDLKDGRELRSSLDAIKGLGVRLVLGRHEEADFRDTDCVIRSPAVPDNSPYLEIARQTGVPIDSETNLFFRYCPSRIVGVTGSNGKSTTTALLGAMLASAHITAHVGGNIGRSLLLELDSIREDDLVVMELSSFQLEDLGRLARSPHGALVTNLAPNHLDRHGTYEAYCEAKRNIIRFQDKGDLAVLNADCADLALWRPVCDRVLYYSRMSQVDNGAFARGGNLILAREGQTKTLMARDEIPLRGEHNVENVLGAAAAASALGAEVEAIAAAVRDFRALPHRLEHVGTAEGMACYNDSIATTPEAAICALRSFDCPICLIAGGYDKGSDFTALGREIASRVRLLILIGETADKIAGGAAGGGAAILRAKNLDQAVSAALERGRAGEVLLLSPACASYDMFRNFEDRGERFRSLIEAHGSTRDGTAADPQPRS